MEKNRAEKEGHHAAALWLHYITPLYNLSLIFGFPFSKIFWASLRMKVNQSSHFLVEVLQ